MTEGGKNLSKPAATESSLDAHKNFAVSYLTGADLESKFTRFAAAYTQPRSSNVDEVVAAIQENLFRPARPAELRLLQKSAKRRGPEALKQPGHRAELIHGFLHHELQAAELFLWAFLKFDDTPIAFRRGLFAIADDEIRHMSLYRDSLKQLGFEYGAFGVRDWFWDRVPQVTSAASFVATMSLGFEGGNLDHTTRFADLFETIGDPTNAALQRRIGEEEIGHVRFGVKWFNVLLGTAQEQPIDPKIWRSLLPKPLSPMVMRGPPLDKAKRRSAGQSEALILAIETYDPTATFEQSLSSEGDVSV